MLTYPHPPARRANRITVSASYLCFLLALCATATASTGTATSSTSATAPTQNIVQSFTPSGGTAGWGWRADSSLSSDAWRDTGQSFTAIQNFSLETITLRSNPQSGVNAPALNAAFTLTIYEFGSIYNETPSATLGTYSGLTPTANLENGNLAPGTYLTFTLSKPLQLTKDKVYGFVFHYDFLANGRSLTFCVTTTNNEYDAGRNLSRLNDNNGSPLASNFTRNGNSLEFYLGEASGPYIPEPATLAFITGLSALVTTAWLRKR